MGTERWYVSMPSDSPLLQRAKVDPEFGDKLSLPWIFSAGGTEREPCDDAITIEFGDAVKQMNANHPGISSRVYTLDRWYEILHYLLAGADRFERRDPEDWTSIAIYGAHPLPEHLRGGQGHPIRYTPAPLVQEIATSLAGLDHGALHLTYDPADMERQGVYKFSIPEDASAFWKWTYEYLDGLQAFYGTVARHGEAVLTIVT